MKIVRAVFEWMIVEGVICKRLGQLEEISSHKLLTFESKMRLGVTKYMADEEINASVHNR